MSKLFLVDTENSVSMQEIFNLGIGPSDEIILVYTDKSKNIPISAIEWMISSGIAICTEHVRCGTPNALDFQLSCLLTMKVLEYEKYLDSVYFYIVSCDKGFDVVVSYLRRKFNTKNISRISQQC